MSVREAAERMLRAWEMFAEDANWGASALRAETIREVNEAPGELRAALADDGWRDISTARIAAALCKSGKFETGQGTCAPICMSVLGDARKHPCPHREKVFEKLAKDIADALFPTPPEQSHD